MVWKYSRKTLEIKLPYSGRGPVFVYQTKGKRGVYFAFSYARQGCIVLHQAHVLGRSLLGTCGCP